MLVGENKSHFRFLWGTPAFNGGAPASVLGLITLSRPRLKNESHCHSERGGKTLEQFGNEYGCAGEETGAGRGKESEPDGAQSQGTWPRARPRCWREGALLPFPPQPCPLQHKDAPPQLPPTGGLLYPGAWGQVVLSRPPTLIQGAEAPSHPLASLQSPQLAWAGLEASCSWPGALSGARTRGRGRVS